MEVRIKNTSSHCDVVTLERLLKQKLNLNNKQEVGHLNTKHIDCVLCCDELCDSCFTLSYWVSELTVFPIQYNNNKGTKVNLWKCTF